ncbi:MAG TPA: magnesium/cobalt transporter CorA [Thermoleophilaceae bacterium]|nr:magnesium/cobalt transporter CorA [Thermoleophilaceae bacterium]
MIVDCAVYEKGERRAGGVDLHDAYEAIRRGDDAWVWIGMFEPSMEEFDSVAREFQLHELAVEDSVKAHQRPKLEVYGDTIFLVLRTAHYIEETEDVELGQIMLFVGPGFVISVRHGKATDLHPVRLRLEDRRDLLRCGPSAVLHAIVDKVVDDYTPVVLGVSQDVEEVEKEVFSDDRRAPTKRIYKLKRETIELHRATEPLIEPLMRLVRDSHDVVHDDIQPYFRDVLDHVKRANENVESLRELLNGTLEANLAQVSVRQNNDMRTITAWAAIAAIPTVIGAIYGMNFRHMPELRWRFGYPLVLIVMALICLLLYRRFKRIGWL